MAHAGNLAEPVRGRVDEDGLLLSADPLLMRLHLHCGGYEGGPLAVPQLAELCRLSRRLGMNLSRPAQAADDESLIDMWVETRLRKDEDADRLDIAIVDWRDQPAPELDVHNVDRQRDFDRLEGRGSIRTDTALRVVAAEIPWQSQNADEMIGQPLLDLFDIIPPSHHARLLEAVSERQPIRNHRMREKHGDKLLLEINGHPLVNRAGAFSGYRLTVEHDDAETGDNGTSRASSKLISDSLFGSQLGPALRQPLGKIIANAETIGSQLEGPLRGDYASYAKDIASAGRHLMDLVNDLSDLEAIERPGFSVEPDPIDMVDLAHRAAGLLAVKAADHQIRIDLPDEGQSAPAFGEFRRTLQILVNLIGNAIRYSPDGSVIKVRVTADEDMARLSVIDQGDGIAPEDQARIFDKFERLGRSGDGGSGLGLFISRKLAHAMSGELTVNSATGKGSTFSLALPARTE